MNTLAISIADAVKVLGLGRTSIYKLINEGRLETATIGRRRLIKTASIQRLLEDAQ